MSKSRCLDFHESMWMTPASYKKLGLGSRHVLLSVNFSTNHENVAQKVLIDHSCRP